MYVGSRPKSKMMLEEMLRAARSRRLPLPEIVLWSTASQHPSESQTSECSDLLSRSRATCLIVAQRQPGKLIQPISSGYVWQRRLTTTGTNRPENNYFAKYVVHRSMEYRPKTKIQKANSTLRASRAVPHPSTDRAFRRLTSEFGWDRVYSTKYGRWRNALSNNKHHSKFRK